MNKKVRRKLEMAVRVRADPELQPYVREAKEGLSRMTSEPR